MADQRRRCANGEPYRVEGYLDLHPTLREDAEGLLDLIYNEVVLREERGEPFALEEYQARFPTLAGPLSDLFEVHRAIDSGDEPIVLAAAGTSEGGENRGEEVPVLLPATKLSGLSGPPDSVVVWPALEGYEIIEVIGSGGMGIVFRAHDRRRGVTVAVKTMQRVDAISIYRFKQEFRALLDVSHPNLIALHELISDGRSWFIVMEFVAGVDFLTYVRRGSGSRVRLRQALRQLAEGLAALHRAGKLHRDVKPSNVLVTHEGRVVIMDFGLATELARGDSMEGQLVGTAGYMAPEQAAGLPTAEASDWYAVGVMLFEALTGRLPFLGRAIDVLMDKQRFEPPPPRELVTDVPEDLDALCVELLRRDPRARPPGSDVVRRLGGAEDETTGSESLSSSHAGDAPFVGREPQYQALNDALATVERGASVVVFVRGRSGVGKSALVQRFLDDLAARDAAVVLAGRCYERESVPYKALDSLIDGLSRYLRRLSTADVNALLPRDVGALGRVFPVLKRVEAVASAPHRGVDVPDPQQLRRRAYAALRELLGRLGDRNTLVLAIDDLQWGDTDSLAVLSEVLRPPDPPALLLLASYRTDEENPFLQALAAWSREEAFDRRLLDIEPLTFDEARALARKLLGGDGPAAERQAEAVARESGGNPFFVAELTRSLQVRDDGAAFKTGVVALDEVLWSRVVRLPVEARRLLEVVAVSGRPVAPATAWRCVEGSGDERASIALLRSGRLLRVAGSVPDGERVETYHDRVREAVVAHLDSRLLSEVHRR
ncbi:MAG: protein kinase, partial [Isosphaeraceae bacterium]|nr:protein kinase [Isosphaeraceae bacterium]